jgi:hypothetical protein
MKRRVALTTWYGDSGFGRDANDYDSRIGELQLAEVTNIDRRTFQSAEKTVWLPCYTQCQESNSDWGCTQNLYIYITLSIIHANEGGKHMNNGK